MRSDRELDLQLVEVAKDEKIEVQGEKAAELAASIGDIIKQVNILALKTSFKTVHGFGSEPWTEFPPPVFEN